MTPEVEDAQVRARIGEKSERNREMLLDYIGGDTYDTVAICHGVSRKRATDIIAREEGRYLDQMELDLMVASHEQIGVGFPQFFVPFDSMAEWQRPMAQFIWTLTHLRNWRQVRLNVTTQQTAEGTIFLLEPKEQ